MFTTQELIYRLWNHFNLILRRLNLFDEMTDNSDITDITVVAVDSDECYIDLVEVSYVQTVAQRIRGK